LLRARRVTVTAYFFPNVSNGRIMARIARLVVPGIAHHVTQRGNRRERTFFGDADRRLYRDWLGIAAAKAGAEMWAYCLMPNHVHAIVTPKDEVGLRRTFGDLHRRTTGQIDARNRWTGHPWQARSGSVAMNEEHLIAAIPYVSLNPVRARLVDRSEDWPWSSVRAHLGRPSRDQFLSAFPRSVIVVTGADDSALGPKTSAAQANSAQHGRLHIIPQCGHYVPLERPEYLNAILREVIATQR
jgi:REP element-mobilizing transposase RayT